MENAIISCHLDEVVDPRNDGSIIVIGNLLKKPLILENERC
jgi:hypothetical protein